MRARTFVFLLVLLAITRAVGAQSTFGSVVGTVQDQSALALPGATVTIRSTDENTTQAAVSDAAGVFQFLNLKAGGYEIQVSLSGFSDATLRNLRLDARQALRVTVTLAIAGVSEEVRVLAEAPAVNTENGTLADSKTFAQVTQLPVNYRGSTTSPLAAIDTVPGVQQDSSGNVSIGGGTPAMVQYSVDGISAVNVRANGALVNLNPSSELIREFKVTSYNNNAEFSQVGDVTITTKSGTNRPHGSLFEYLQNAAFDSKIYGFDSKPAKAFNTFGGSVGGPVVVPGLYDGHNRTFFFSDVESNRRRTDTPQQLSVPTAAMRGGDLGTLGPVVDPRTGVPFPGNQIPADRINPVSQRLLNLYYPLPNLSAADTNANLRQLVPTPSDTNGYDIRIDHTFSQQHQVYGRWSAKNLSTTVANTLLPSEVDAETNRNLVLSHNWVVSSTLINELRFGTSRYHLGVGFPIAGASAIQQLGLQGLDISNHAGVNAFPIFDFSDGTGFSPIGRDKTGVTESQTTQISDNLIWIRGKHALKFGADIRLLRYQDLESFGGADDFGALTFSANTFSGNAFADFLLGLPAKTYVARSGPDIDGRARQLGFYGQDTWAAGSRLTLNYGVRWQILPPFTEQNGNITVFDKQTGGVIIPGVSQPTPGFLTSINACPGVNPALPCAPIETAQQAGLGPGLRRVYLGNVQPRLSVAYRLDGEGETVIRGGVGVYTMTQLGQLAFNITDIHVSDLRTDVNAIGSNGQPLYQLPAVHGPSNPIDVAGTGEFYQNVPVDYRDPQAVQWNATVERSLPGSTAVRASYVGMHTYRMNVTVDLNQVPASAQTYNLALRPYANWGRILSSENLGWSTYHALQLEVNRRLHRDLAFQASYTLARNVGNIGGDAPTGFTPEVIYGQAVTDRFNLGANVGNIAATRRHRVLLTGTYVLPLVRWELSTVTLLQSGPYLTPTISPVFDAANVNALGRGTIVRPDVVADPTAGGAPGTWWNINAFSATPAGAGRVGDAAVGSLEGPGTFTIAAGLAREFAVARGFRGRVEVTFTNILNRTNFAAPATDVTTPATFGKTTSVQSAENAGNRTGQVAFRLVF
ncbi:MAG TPA: carboxypeptidase-like regulatory domain-containing protein [Vicinamibacterales bacterium]|nr:carboxypeptidase-like regulatory domain-containing protein [Vicinamibacterales bacterium]